MRATIKIAELRRAIESLRLGSDYSGNACYLSSHALSDDSLGRILYGYQTTLPVFAGLENRCEVANIIVSIAGREARLIVTGNTIDRASID